MFFLNTPEYFLYFIVCAYISFYYEFFQTLGNNDVFKKAGQRKRAGQFMPALDSLSDVFKLIRF